MDNVQKLNFYKFCREDIKNGCGNFLATKEDRMDRMKDFACQATDLFETKYVECQTDISFPDIPEVVLKCGGQPPIFSTPN